MVSQWPFFDGSKHKYWNSVFILFLFSFFLPFGSGVTKTVFYLLICLPALLSFRKTDLTILVGQPSFLLLISLCTYAALRSEDQQSLMYTFKATIAIFLLLIAALRLPSLQPDKVKRFSLILILFIFFYIFANAAFQNYSYGWRLGQRLAPLFGQSKSVIFTADLLLSSLAAYSWSCVKTRDFKYLALVHIVVVSVAMYFLQTRSIIPAWLVCSVAMIATQIKGKRNILIAIGIILFAVSAAWLTLDLSGMTHIITARGDSYRSEIWSAYLAATSNCGIILGCGWGHELNHIAHDGFAISHPHSMYIQHFYWGGLIGLFLLFACISVPLIKGVQLSKYLSWPLIIGSVALGFDGKSLISMPNERWLLVLLPLVILIGECAKFSQTENTKTALTS